MSNEDGINDLVMRVAELEAANRNLKNECSERDRMLEKSNAEKQQWKQCAHTLADALEQLIYLSYEDVITPEYRDKAEKVLDQFKKMQ